MMLWIRNFVQYNDHSSLANSITLSKSQERYGVSFHRSLNVWCNSLCPTLLFKGIRPWPLGSPLNTLRLRQNCCHFPDDIFKCIFLNRNAWIAIKISLKFVPMGPINNIPALVQIMAWRRPGDKPLFEPMMVRLPTHLCVTWPHWIKGPVMKKGFQYHDDFMWYFF